MREEKHQRTWETQLVPARAGKWSRPKAGELKTSWESDQLIVLSERESRSQGEGADVDTKPTKETLTEHEGTDNGANLPVGTSEAGPEQYAVPVSPSVCLRKRVSTKSPVRENCTPGSVRGLLGNQQSYRDRQMVLCVE